MAPRRPGLKGLRQAHLRQRRLPRTLDLRPAGRADAGRPAPALLPGHPAGDVRAGDHRPACRAGWRGGPGGRREALRARRGLGARAERGAVPGLPRGVSLPRRPLPRQGVGRGPADLPVRQLDAGAAVEPQLRLQRPGDDGGGVRRRGAGEVLRVGGGAARRLPEPPAAGGGAAGHGPAGVGRRGRAQRREGPPVAPGAAARPRAGGAGPVPGLHGRAGRRGGQRRRDLRRGAAGDRLVALGGGAVAGPHRQAPAGHRHRGGRHLQGAAPHAVRPLGGTTPPAEIRLRFRLGVDDGVTLHLQTKAPGDDLVSRPVDLEVSYARSSRTGRRRTSACWRTRWRRPPAFGRADGVEEQWRIVEPVLRNPAPVELYRKGTWGPSGADALASAVGGWIEPLADG